MSLHTAFRVHFNILIANKSEKTAIFSYRIVFLKHGQLRNHKFAFSLNHQHIVYYTMYSPQLTELSRV